MNKEKIITVIIGLFLGAVAFTSYFFIKNNLPKKVAPVVIQPEEKKVPTPTPEVSGVSDFDFTLDKPEDKSSTTSSTITLSGKTAPGATLVLFSNADEKIASADATGNFNSSIKLETGENEISATAFLNKTTSLVIHRNATLEVIE